MIIVVGKLLKITESTSIRNPKNEPLTFDKKNSKYGRVFIP